MAKTRVAINGFGRIGRGFLRAAVNDAEFSEKFEVVAVNDLVDAKTLAHLFKYDSVHLKFEGEVKSTENSIIVNGQEIKVLGEKDPEKFPWAQLGVDFVLESTGRFVDREGAAKHLKAGAKKVVISAPGKNEDISIVIGVNDDKYDKQKHNIISMCSCTTNSIAPPCKILHRTFGIKRAFMTTVHAYTGDQRILDSPHKDLRRARAAAASIIPTTTGAAKAIALAIPELKGKMDGIALRVPVVDGSVSDITLELEKETTKEEINAALKQAAEGELKGVMEYTEDPIVSVDIIGNPHTAIIDGLATIAIGGKSNFVKILSWYDNEWGFSVKLVELMKKL
ncbi:type I glyceraldehyde-3-phosphate dehydrogenase [Candidatus Micrarchaeota archaeon]|nr:type I glyceraldehyde-3-phosphate dehydrogenase [Candidatus Micrarchaeota archaeon]